MAAQIIRTIKIDYAGDMRRIPFDVIEGADSAHTLRAIREAVATCFHVEETVLPNLKYRDDDGDLCTLVACTVDDMLQLAGTGPLRLFVDEAAESDTKERSSEWELADENKLGNELDMDSQELDADRSSATQLVGEEVPITQQADDIETPVQPLTPTTDGKMYSSHQNGAVDEVYADRTSATQQVGEEVLIAEQAGNVDTPAPLPAPLAAPATDEDDEKLDNPAGPPVETVTQDTAVVDDAPQLETPEVLDMPGVRASPNPVLQLMTMGFPEDKAREALAACDGDVERAAAYLLEGPPPEQFPQVKNVLRQVRQWLLDLKEHVHDAALRRQEQQGAADGGANDADQRLQSLQAKVAELRAKLGQVSQQCTDHAIATASGIKTSMDEKYGEDWEQERLKKVDAQLEDADRFLRETLDALQERASAILASALDLDAAAEPPQTATSEHETSPDVVSRSAEAAPVSVSDDTVRAAADASESAAEAAIATVDAFLRDEAGESGYPSVHANTSQAASSSTVLAPASPVREPVLATPLPLSLCSTGCGKPAAQGYSTCCRTCVNSGGQAHGPKCTVKSVGRRIFGSLINPVSEPSQDDSQSREAALPETITDEMAPASEGEINQGADLQEQVAATPEPADVAALIAMGFADEDVQEALKVSDGNVEMALDHLLASHFRPL